MDRSPYLIAESPTMPAVCLASASSTVRFSVIFLYISSWISEIRTSRRITPPSLVLKGFPSLPFMVPNPRKRSRVSSGTIPLLRAARNTWTKCSS